MPVLSRKADRGLALRSRRRIHPRSLLGATAFAGFIGFIGFVGFVGSAGCGGSEESTAELTAVAAAARAAIPSSEELAQAAPSPTERLPGERLRVHSAAQLDAFASLATVRELDLALSGTDRIDQAAGGDEGDPCLALDLRRLSGRVPALRRLRISGCQAAVHAGLDSFTDLRELELVDLVLDGVTMGRLLALPALETLTLTRVTPGSESQSMLRGLKIERLSLRDLARESPLTELLDLLRGLRAVELHGSWANHKTMLLVAKADRLRELVIRETEISNFSLNQVKGLEQLAKVDLRGHTFNDKTPLYFRELPVTSFTCACPGLGENGLRSLRHIKGLTELRILSSRIVAPSDENLGELKALETLTYRGQDPGAAGFAALAKLEHLREFELEIEPGELQDPKLHGLGELRGLRRLLLKSPELDDRIAPQFAELRELEVLELGGTSISDASLAAVADMPRLTRLILHHTRVTNRGLANLAGLTKLEVLELDHTDVVDAGVAHLRGLSSLRELRLDATLITDRSLGTIAGLENLERLNIADTVVTSAGVEQLQGLAQLRSVNLARTRASPGPTPEP